MSDLPPLPTGAATSASPPPPPAEPRPLPPPQPEPDRNALSFGEMYGTVEGGVDLQALRRAGLPTVADPTAAAKLPPGTRFLNPAGDILQTPYRVQTRLDALSLPEDAKFVDPQTGQITPVPAQESLDVGTQILYDMAGDKRRQRQILNSAYGHDAVIEVKDGFRVRTPDGHILKPDTGGSALLGLAASEAAPMALGTVGAIAGAGVGLPTAVGTPVGAAVGGGLGAMAGRGFNDMILAMAGVRDQAASDVTNRYLKEGVAGAVGTLLGGAVGGGVGAVRAGVNVFKKSEGPLYKKLGQTVPATMRYMLGTNPEKLDWAYKLAEGTPDKGIPGIRVTPSAVHEEAPFFSLMAEFDARFRQSSPIQKGRELYYEAAGGNLAKGMGIGRTESLLHPTKGVDVYPLGKALQDRATELLDIANQGVDEALRQSTAAAQARASGQVVQQERLGQMLHMSVDRLMKAAQAATDAGFQQVDDRIAAALAKADSGMHAGDLWRNSAMELEATKGGFKAASHRMYVANAQIAGNTPLDVTLAGSPIQVLKDTLPEAELVQGRLPRLVQGIKEIINGQTPPTFDQVHNLRSLARDDPDWSDPTPDVTEGFKRKVASIIDDWLYHPAQPAVVQQAAAGLKPIDNYYARNITKYKNQVVKTIVQKWDRGYGQASDAEELARIAMPARDQETRDLVRKLVKPTLWQGIQAAHVNGLLKASKLPDLVPGVPRYDARDLARNVLASYRNGTLDAGYEADLFRQAKRLEAVEKGAVPIDADLNDTVMDLVRKAGVYQERAERVAEFDPMALLKEETRNLEKEATQERGANRKGFGQLESHLLPDKDLPPSDLTLNAVEAGNAILDKPGLTMAVASLMGESSPEFKLLQRVAVERMLDGDERGS